MKVLLDTHTFIWFNMRDRQLSTLAAGLISDPDTDVFISPASYLELAIKISIGKFKLEEPFYDFWQQAMSVNNIDVLPVEVRHAERMISLPFHHKDPFDRLIVAQALQENMQLISADAQFDAYGVKRIF